MVDLITIFPSEVRLYCKREQRDRSWVLLSIRPVELVLDISCCTWHVGICHLLYRCPPILMKKKRKIERNSNKTLQKQTHLLNFNSFAITLERTGLAWKRDALLSQRLNFVTILVTETRSMEYVNQSKNIDMNLLLRHFQGSKKINIWRHCAKISGWFWKF